jgi:transcriptional regulator with XRE-family HTH domain
LVNPQLLILHVIRVCESQHKPFFSLFLKKKPGAAKVSKFANDKGFYFRNYVGMKNRIRYFRKLHGLTQQQLGDRMGKVKSDISKLETGKAELTQSLMETFAKIFGCAPKDILEETDAPTVPVIGRIAAGNQIHFTDKFPFAQNVMEHKNNGSNCEFVEPPAGGIYRDIAAAKVDGDSMEPFMPLGTIVYFSERRTGDLKEYLNKLCVVKLKSGIVLLKKLKRSPLYGRYTLSSYNAPDMEDVDIEWCAKVIFIKPA